MFLVAALSVASTAIGCNRSQAAPQTSTTPATTVVLVANMGEADEECTCGEIIRAVRAASKRGVATREIDTQNGKDDAREFRALVVPTVVMLDGAGNEIRRYEGESSDAFRKIKADLDAALVASK